jgi:hypothetical protein
MSKIALTTNASGTGVFTIASPATSTDRALTLPDADGSIVVNTASGIDVTGTVVADGLTVDGSSASTLEQIALNNNNSSFASGVKISASFDSDSEEYGNITWTPRNGTQGYFQINNLLGGSLVKALEIDGNDISFYEATGTTAKFFWDSSAESLGIGTTAPAAKLDARTTHTSTDVTAANSNSTVIVGNSGVGNGIYNAIKFAGNQQDMYIMSFNNSATADRRLGFFLGSVAGDAVADERLSIMGDGFVGIGTTTVDSLLHLQKSDTTTYSATATDGQVGIGPTIYLENPANSNATVGGQIVFGMRSTESQARIGATGGASPALVFGTNDAERMRIDSSGHVIVGGTSTVGYKFHVYGDSAFERTGTASQTMIVFRNGNGNVGTINTSGQATSYNISSDYRLKTDAQPMTGASARVQALNPVNFEWIADGTRVDGFLAHEAQEVVPECVTGTKDAMRDEEYEVTAAIEATYDDDGNELTAAVEAVMGTRSVPDMQGIDQSKLVPLLTAALQEALNKIDAMEIRLSALEG